MPRTWEQMAANKTDERSFMRRVKEAAGYKCEGLKLLRVLAHPVLKAARVWARCNSQDRLASAHLIPRAQCATMIFQPIVGICLCWTCHKIFDCNTLGTPPYTMRVPEQRYEKAFRAVSMVSKVPPKRRLSLVAPA